MTPIPQSTSAMECKCTLRGSLVGDGCPVCQPDTWADMLADDSDGVGIHDPAAPSAPAEPMVSLSIGDAERLAALLLNGRCPTSPDDVAAYTRLCDALAGQSREQGK